MIYRPQCLNRPAGGPSSGHREAMLLAQRKMSTLFVKDMLDVSTMSCCAVWQIETLEQKTKESLLNSSEEKARLKPFSASSSLTLYKILRNTTLKFQLYLLNIPNTCNSLLLLAWSITGCWCLINRRRLTDFIPHYFWVFRLRENVFAQYVWFKKKKKNKKNVLNFE